MIRGLFGLFTLALFTIAMVALTGYVFGGLWWVFTWGWGQW